MTDNKFTNFYVSFLFYSLGKKEKIVRKKSKDEILDGNKDVDTQHFVYFPLLEEKSQSQDVTFRAPSRGRPRGNNGSRKRQPTDTYGCPYCNCTRNYSHNLYSHIRSKHHGCQVYCIDYQAADKS